MFAIVALHSADGVSGTLQQGKPGLVLMLTTPLKFGTIAFFLISGFLLGERFETSSPVAFLRKRMEKVFLPWLFWFCLQVSYSLAIKIFVHGVPFSLDRELLRVVLTIAQSCLLSTCFWFVPNLLVAICVLMVFRKYLHKLWLGAALFAVNLFYVVNIYQSWFPTTHTAALFGFVAYLWLGAAGAKHHQRWSQQLERASTQVVVAAVVVACLLSYAESHLLQRLHAQDPMNTLRLSNQLFSVLVVLLLMKLRRRTWPAFLDARSEMFSVYLGQTLIISLAASVTKRLLMRANVLGLLGTNTSFVIAWAALTSAVLLSCLAIGRLLVRRHALSWIVGRSGDRQTDSRINAERLGESALSAPFARLGIASKLIEENGVS